jgi:hypothetical protein
MFRTLLALTLLWMPCSCCLLPGVAQAQNISIKEVQQAFWTFPGAEIVSGQVVVPVDVRPKLDRVETTVRVESVVEFKFGKLTARRLPSFERVTLDEVSKGVYKFKPSAPEGTYLLEYSAYDPEKGLDSSEATITLARGPAIEVDPIGPLPTPSNDIERIVNNAMLEMRRNYGNAFKRTSEAISAGQLDTDDKLVKFMNPLTKAAREQAVAGIDGLLQDKIPRDGSKLKPEAAGFFRDIALAFEKGTK